MFEPLIWVLCGAKAGDTAQAIELAQRVGGAVVEKRLSFNALHMLPNVVKPKNFGSLTAQSRAAFQPPWPDLVIATGKRTAPIAVAIKARSAGATKLVQLGRPRMTLKAFDLVITTPQYGLPSAPNVVMLPVPFASAKSVDQKMLTTWQKTWARLPRPWIMAVIGGQKYPLRLSVAELSGFGRALNAAAKQEHASVLLFDSPRSTERALETVSNALSEPHWQRDQAEVTGAYQSALALADFFAVTGDSVSMVTEMLSTGKPVSILKLPRRATLNWSARDGVGAALARRGLLSPPRDVDGFMSSLLAAGRVGPLGQSWVTPVASGDDHNAVVKKIRLLLTQA